MCLIFRLLFLTSVIWPVAAVKTSELEYCSSQNTNASSQAVPFTFQSVGACTTTCKNYAFGILLGSRCWCSNVAPAPESNTNITKCDYSCPGYPDDPCGNPRQGLYGYIPMLLNMPSSTATLPSTATITSKTSSYSNTIPTAETATTAMPASSRLLLTKGPEDTHSSTTATIATVTTSTSSSITAVETVNGQVTTIVTSLPISTHGAVTSSGSNTPGIGKGTVAGIVIGSVGGSAAIIAAIFVIFVVRRRSRSDSLDMDIRSGLSGGDRSGKSSQAGFIRSMFDNHSHTLSIESSNIRGQTFTDNRMKTGTMLYAGGDRNSSLSLQDNEDYSRPVLRLTNPD